MRPSSHPTLMEPPSRPVEPSPADPPVQSMCAAVCDGESQDRLLRIARTPEPHPRRRRSHHRGHDAVRAGCGRAGDVQPVRGVRGNGRTGHRRRRHRCRSRDRSGRIRDRHLGRRPRRRLHRALGAPRRRAPLLRRLRSRIRRLRRGRDRRASAPRSQVRPQGRHHFARARAPLPARQPGPAQGQERHGPRSRRPLARASRARAGRQPHRRLVGRTRAAGRHRCLRRGHPRHAPRTRCREHIGVLAFRPRRGLRREARHPSDRRRRVRPHRRAVEPAHHLHHGDGARARPRAPAAADRPRRGGLPRRRTPSARRRPGHAAKRRPRHRRPRGCGPARPRDHPPARAARRAAGDGCRAQRGPGSRRDLPRRGRPPERHAVGGGAAVAHLRAPGTRDRPCPLARRRGRQGRAGSASPLRRAPAHPTVRAHELAAAGRADEFTAALAALYGIAPEADAADDAATA